MGEVEQLVAEDSQAPGVLEQYTKTYKKLIEKETKSQPALKDP